MFFASKCVKFVLSSILEDYKRTDVNALTRKLTGRPAFAIVDELYYLNDVSIFHLTCFVLIG